MIPDKRWLKEFYLTDNGGTAVEYALLISCIAAVIVAGVTALGMVVQGMYQDAQLIFQG